MSVRWLMDRLPRGLGSTVLTQAAMLAFGAASGILAARLLGPAGRGELAALILWPSMLVFLAAMGINQAVVFFTGKRAFSESEVWTASFVLGIGQSLVVILVGILVIPLALRHYSPEVRDLSYVYLAFSPFVILAGYPGNIFQGRLELKRFNLLRTIPPAVYALGLLLLFAVGRPDLGWVVAFQVLGCAVALTCGFLLLRKSGLFRTRWNPSAWRKMLGYGFKTQLGNVGTLVNRSLDQLLLSLFVAPRELGLYTVAVTAAATVGILPQAAGIVTLASGSNADGEEAKSVVARNFRVSLLWLVLTCVGMFILAGPLIRFVFGSAFVDSTLACRILLPGMVALGLNQVLFDGARSFGHPALPSYAEGFAACLTVLGLYLLLPRYGFVGAAIASTCAYVGSFAFMLILIHMRMGVSLLELVGIGRSTVSRPAFDESLVGRRMTG